MDNKLIFYYLLIISIIYMFIMCRLLPVDMRILHAALRLWNKKRQSLKMDGWLYGIHHRHINYKNNELVEHSLALHNIAQTNNLTTTSSSLPCLLVTSSQTHKATERGWQAVLNSILLFISVNHREGAINITEQRTFNWCSFKFGSPKGILWRHGFD